MLSRPAQVSVETGGRSNTPVLRTVKSDAGTSVELPQEATTQILKVVSAAPQICGTGTGEELGTSAGEGGDGAQTEGEESDTFPGLGNTQPRDIIEIEDEIVEPKGSGDISMQTEFILGI